MSVILGNFLVLLEKHPTWSMQWGELRPDVPIIKECYVDVSADLFYLIVKTPIDFKKVVVDFEAQTFTFVKDDFYMGTALGDGNPMLIRELMNSVGEEVNVKFEFYK